MNRTPNLPDGWTLESEEETYDSRMGRAYTTVRYRRADTGTTVRLFEVLEAKANNWGYHVRSSGRNGDLGFAEDLEAAKEIALAYMTEHRPPSS